METLAQFKNTQKKEIKEDHSDDEYHQVLSDGDFDIDCSG